MTPTATNTPAQTGLTRQDLLDRVLEAIDRGDHAVLILPHQVKSVSLIVLDPPQPEEDTDR